MIFTGTEEEIVDVGKQFGLLNGAPDVGDSTSHVLLGCYNPKKGEYFIRPSGRKGIVHVELAECDHKKRNYPIIHRLIGDSLRIRESNI